MPTVDTNVLVDLNALNTAYSQNKGRIDNLVSGDTASKYAEKIGSSSSEGTVSPSTIGGPSNPVYVSAGTIVPIVENLNSSHSIAIGNSNTTNFTLGGSSGTTVISRNFSAAGSVSGPIGSFGSFAETPEVRIKGSGSRSASIVYNSDLDALVFNFS